MISPPLVLPLLPDWPQSSFAIIGTHQWAVLGETLARLHAEHVTLLGQFTTVSEDFMSAIADLTAAVAATDAKVDALIAAYTAARNNPNTTFTPADQAALDAAVSALTAEGAAVDV